MCQKVACRKDILLRPSDYGGQAPPSPKASAGRHLLRQRLRRAGTSFAKSYGGQARHRITYRVSSSAYCEL